MYPLKISGNEKQRVNHQKNNLEVRPILLGNKLLMPSFLGGVEGGGRNAVGPQKYIQGTLYS